LTLFLYYAQLDWHHPDYYPRGSTGQYTGRPECGDWNTYLDYVNQQLAELVGGAYGPVGGVWLDGWWDQQTKLLEGHENADPRTTNIDWRLRRTYDLIHSLQPACLIGNNHHVAPFEGEDFQMFERDLPGQNVGGHSPDADVGNLPLETCNTINDSWGYNADDRNYKSASELIRYLVRTAGANANFLLNVGPLPDGTIDPEMVRRLEAIGRWMSKYGHTVRGVRGGPIGAQRWGTSTHTADVIYLHILDRSTADANGWITLTGADSLAEEVVSTLDGASVETRFSNGELQVNIGQERELVDLVLTVRKFDHP
jgi:alpha-L-fucosidase